MDACNTGGQSGQSRRADKHLCRPGSDCSLGSSELEIRRKTSSFKDPTDKNQIKTNQNQNRFYWSFWTSFEPKIGIKIAAVGKLVSKSFR